MVSRNADAHISTQLRASVLLLLQLLFVREGVLNCSVLSSHDIDDLIDFICILKESGAVGVWSLEGAASPLPPARGSEGVSQPPQRSPEWSSAPSLNGFLIGLF